MIIPRSIALRSIQQGRKQAVALSIVFEELFVVLSDGNAYRAVKKDYEEGLLVWDGKKTSIVQH